jgi:hypothetical protein
MLTLNQLKFQWNCVHTTHFILIVSYKFYPSKAPLEKVVAEYGCYGLENFGKGTYDTEPKRISNWCCYLEESYEIFTVSMDTALPTHHNFF